MVLFLLHMSSKTFTFFSVHAYISVAFFSLVCLSFFSHLFRLCLFLSPPILPYSPICHPSFSLSIHIPLGFFSLRLSVNLPVWFPSVPVYFRSPRSLIEFVVMSICLYVYSPLLNVLLPLPQSLFLLFCFLFLCV